MNIVGVLESSSTVFTAIFLKLNIYGIPKYYSWIPLAVMIEILTIQAITIKTKMIFSIFFTLVSTAFPLAKRWDKYITATIATPIARGGRIF